MVCVLVFPYYCKLSKFAGGYNDVGERFYGTFCSCQISCFFLYYYEKKWSSPSRETPLLEKTGQRNDFKRNHSSTHPQPQKNPLKNTTKKKLQANQKKTQTKMQLVSKVWESSPGHWWKIKGLECHGTCQHQKSLGGQVV